MRSQQQKSVKDVLSFAHVCYRRTTVSLENLQLQRFFCLSVSELMKKYYDFHKLVNPDPSLLVKQLSLSVMILSPFTNEPVYRWNVPNGCFFLLASNQEKADIYLKKIN